jgi:hypothetical protein
VCVFLITVALIAGMAGCVYTPLPYTPLPSQNLEIRTWYDLNAVRNNLAGNHTLMNDLDSATAGYEELAGPTANGGKGWHPIGTFTGSFDGQGYEIHNLFINRPDEGAVGLFRVVGEGGRIEDIGVVNVTAVGESFGGGLAGSNYGTISNCYVTGSVSGGDQCIGGLVGINEETVNNCYSAGSVTGGFFVGGLVGLHDNGNVSNSYSTGSVTGDGAVGGLVGYIFSGTVSNSYATGSVTGNKSVGGLVGSNEEGTVSNCYATGSVTGNSYVGGLVGWSLPTDNYGSIVRNSYYNYDKVLINGENIITIGALFGGDFEEWLANDKFLDVNERLSQESGYYLINDVSDFKQLLAFGQNASLKFKLTDDLDLATEPNFYIPCLAGEFDGNGHKISNLSLDSDLASPLGLFGYFAPGGKVTQLGAENVNITGAWGVGGLVGINDEGTVSNSYSTGSVSGYKCVGGLVGWKDEGIIDNSYSTCSVSGNRSVGGLVGDNSGTVSNCYSTGSVSGTTDVGGLIGRGITVSNSFWDIETSEQPTSAGGTGKTTAQMKDITTFSGASWDIIAVAFNETNSAYIWNIVDNVTYPFLSWQST